MVQGFSSLSDQIPGGLPENMTIVHNLGHLKTDFSFICKVSGVDCQKAFIFQR